LEEYFMFCRDMFKAVNDCSTSEDISWSNCVGICTDGAVVLTGHKKGFQDEAAQAAPHYKLYYIPQQS
jgi:hypothetical protein